MRIIYLLIVFIVTECYGINYNLYHPVHYFTNQEALIKELKNLLNINDGVANISGVKGVGKTELVKKYYLEHRNNYKIVGYFDSSISLVPQLINFAQKINTLNNQNELISLDPQNIQKNVIKYLNEVNDWLLIFDNILFEDNISKDFLSLKGKGHIIFISCYNKTKDNKLIVNTLDIKHIDKLLKKIIVDVDNNLIEELSKSITEIGYPTALIVDSAYFLFRNPHYTVTEYNKKIKSKNEMVKNHLEIIIDTLNNPARDLLFKIALLNNKEISKHVLSYLVNQETPNEIISELLNTNILQMKNKDREKPIFSIHDVYKDEILNILTLKQKQQMLHQITFEINKIFPVKFKNGSEVRKIFAIDQTLIANIENLLLNIKKYEVRTNFDILELVLNIVLNSIELCYMDKYYEGIEWFSTQLNTQKFIPNNFREKITFCTILINLAAYEMFDNINYSKALKYLYQAHQVTLGSPEFDELNSYIYTDIAQVLAIKGDVVGSKKFVEKAEKIIDTNTSGIVKILYIQSLINLLEGNYHKSLEKINEEILLCNKFNFSVQNPPLVVQKARILNYLKKYNEGYVYINQWYTDNLKEFNSYATDDKSAILTQLSNAELNNNKVSEALNHAKLAINILLEDNKRNNILPLENSIDIFLAEALVAYGNALSEMDMLREALIEYNRAEKIYRNVYQENFSKIDNVSYLLFQGAKVSYKLHDKFWYKHYSGLLKKYLPITHERVQELVKDYNLDMKAKL